MSDLVGFVTIFCGISCDLIQYAVIIYDFVQSNAILLRFRKNLSERVILCDFTRFCVIWRAVRN